jgi:hypothetical protein
MLLHVNMVTDEETLKRWNYQEIGIEFYDDNELCAFPISRVSGYGIKKMLEEWHTGERLKINSTISNNKESPLASDSESKEESPK